MKSINVFSVLLLSLVSLNSFASKVVCSSQENYGEITRWASIQSLNNNLSKEANAIITTPVFYEEKDLQGNTLYVSCVGVSTK